MTPEEARAELARMDSLEGNNEGITPEEAQAMLATMPKPKTTLDLGVGEEGQYDFSPKPIPQTALPKPIPPSDTIREDGTPKADGFLGPLKRPDGQVSTEISIGVFFDGKERLIPSLVPGLTESEIGSLLVDGEITKAIQKKAVAHARMRIKQGLSPFKEVGETPYKNVNAKKNTFAENWNQAASAESEMMSRPENLAGAAGVSGTIAAAIPALTAVGLTQITGIAAEKAKKLGLFNSDTDYMDAANYVSSEIARQIIPGGIEGAKASAGAMVPFEKWSEMANAASESEFKRTGNALWATAVLTALEAVPYGLGYGVAKGAIKGVPKVVKGLETHITAGPKELRMAAWQKAGYDVPVASGEVIAPNLYPSSVVRSLNALTPNKAPDTKAFITPEGAVIYIEKGDGIYTPMSNTLDGTPTPIRHTALRPSKDLKKVQYEMDKFVAKTNYAEAPNIIKVNTKQPTGDGKSFDSPLTKFRPTKEQEARIVDTGRKGYCYKFALNEIRDNPLLSDARYVVGTYEGQPHAWLEKGNAVYEPVQHDWIQRDVFYSGKAESKYNLSRDEAVTIARSTGKYPSATFIEKYYQKTGGPPPEAPNIIKVNTPPPEQPVGPISPVKSQQPDWLRDEMIKRGLDPNRPLNDYDIRNPSVIDAIKNDPSLSEIQKERILKTGSPNEILKTTPVSQGHPVPEAPLASRPPVPPEIKTPASAKYETVDDILNSDSPAASTYRWMEGGIIDTLKRENFWDTFAREAIDVSEPAKRRLRKLGPAGVKAEMRRDFIIHAPTSAAQIFKDVSPLIYEGLNIKEAKTLDRLIFSKRVIEIDSYKIGHKHPTEPKFRGPKGDQSLTGLDHLVQIDEINRLEPGLRDSLHQRANVYFQTMREHIVEPLYREGLLNDNQYAALASHIYEPRKMLEHVDPGFMSSGGKTITSPDSGIKRLKEGTLEAMELDSQLLLGDALARTQGRIFTNRANKALYEIAVNDPIFTGAEIVPGKKPEGNGIVRLLKGEESPRPGHNVVTVMVEGKQHRLELPNEVYNDWVVSDPIFNRATAEVLGWATGTKILKSMATGYNPAFAMTNLPRDMLHILMTTNEYSSFLPVGIKQLVGDLRATRKDAWHTQRVGGKLERTGEFFKQYQREGGMGEYFTHQGGGGYGTPGRFLGEGRHVSDSLEGVKKFLGYIGESSEIWTRLAVKRRAMLNGKNAEESTWAANNYLDFLQGGHTSKALDSLLPYFGAGVQGSRGIFRAWKRNPVLSAWKAAQLMTASTLLAMANYAWNPKAMSNVETKERTGNFIVTTPFSFFDKNGNERDNYLKVAKDQAQRVFATIAEAIVARVFEGRKPGPEIYDAIGALIPITPDKFFPPVWSAWLALHADIDLYTNDEVWPSEQEIYDYLKYTNTTNPAWVKLGELSKDLLGEKNSISPINFERGAMKILTAGNPYTDVVGAGLRQLMDGDKTGQTYAGINEELVNNATLRRIMNATPGVPRQDRQDIKDAMIATASAQKIQNRALQLILEKKGTDLFALNKAFREYINTQPRYDRKRLETRIKRLQRGLDIPNINTWLSRAELEPHSRAVNLLLVLKNTPEDKKGEILSIAHRVPEYWSEDFAEQWSMVRAETGY